MCGSTISLTLFDNVIVIDPWFSSLKKALTANIRKSTVVQGKTQYHIQNEELFYLVDSCCYAFPGLLNTIKETLDDKGVTYTITDKRSERIVPDQTQLAKADYRPGQEELIEAVVNNYRGVIKAAPGFGKTFVIERLCESYPDDTKVLVVTNRKSVLNEIYNRVSACVNTTKLHAGQPVVPESKVIVCSSKSLHRLPADWADIIFYDEVHNCASDKTRLDVAGIMAPQMYGFSATPFDRQDKANLITISLFGDQIYEQKYDESVSHKTVVPIDVWIMKYDSSFVDCRFDWQFDKFNIWNNSDRNAKIAEAANYFGPNKKVLILCRVVEHVLRLKELLPEFDMVHTGVDEKRLKYFNKKGLWQESFDPCPDIASLTEDFKSSKIQKIIATTCWREGVDFKDLDVLIRADAGAGKIDSIQMGGRVSRVAAEKKKGIVIDLFDDFHPRYKGKSKARLKHYDQEGWTIKYGLQ